MISWETVSEMCVRVCARALARTTYKQDPGCKMKTQASVEKKSVQGAV